jgi:hypothetical protein
MLPSYLRRRAVVEQFDVARFLEAWSALRPMRPVETIGEDLRLLVGRATTQS